MPPHRLNSRSHRIPPRGFRIPENTTRPPTPMTPLNPIPAMISTMVATHGVTIEVISPNGDMSRTNPEFENIARAAIDIAYSDSDGPRISSGEIDIEEDLEEENRFLAALYYDDGRMRNMIVKILFDYTNRIEAINEILESVDVETLDSEHCSICIESYTTAATLSEPETVVTNLEATSEITNGFEDSIDISNESHHTAVKIKKCGHIFGRRCITQWLKDNNTCPMCRRKASLPVPFHLQMWVE
ncbi:uncharacterized protein EAF02_012172 [Botrytis sinoallii]|uniref:uncharacterized protein n=1 Tax=Botrytis sinoallii TaxID=1463999 RepID=UPI0019014D4D|nr:uncharacterized protein EAF02_012172 [Botrytis sinoallii]KAF7852585.1 hypothetical protein EAF02_012172 [Botrytis sinoallii]